VINLGGKFQQRLCEHDVVQLLIGTLSDENPHIRINSLKAIRILAENHQLVRKTLNGQPANIATIFSGRNG
jgi:hypothetical protein